MSWDAGALAAVLPARLWPAAACQDSSCALGRAAGPSRPTGPAQGCRCSLRPTERLVVSIHSTMLQPRRQASALTCLRLPDLHTRSPITARSLAARPGTARPGHAWLRLQPKVGAKSSPVSARPRSREARRQQISFECLRQPRQHSHARVSGPPSLQELSQSAAPKLSGQRLLWLKWAGLPLRLH